MPGQPEEFEQFQRFFARFRFLRSAKDKRKGYIVDDPFPRKQHVFLHHVSDLSVQGNASRVGLFQPGYYVEQSRFSAAADTEDRNELVFLYMKRDVPDHLEVVEFLAYAGNLQSRRTSCF